MYGAKLGEKPTAMGRENIDDPHSPVIGYMCLVDYECELGCADDGNKIFPSIEDCREYRGCTDACGIVEVEVRARKIVQEPSLR